MGINKDYKILLIGRTREFLMTSVMSEMERRRYKVEICNPVRSEVVTACENAKICLLFVDIADALKDMFIFLRDNAFDKKFEVCLVGEKLEIKEALKEIGKYNVGRYFERPANSKEISDGLEVLYQKALKNNERKSILIIDDEPECLRRTQQILHNHYKIYVANSGASALMLLGKHEVNLILLDYMLPVIDGAQVLQMLKKEPSTKDIPVIFLSGVEDEAAVSYTEKLGAEGYIYKCAPAETLITTISDYFTKIDWNKYAQAQKTEYENIW